MFQAVPDTALFVAKFAGPNGVTPTFGVYSRNAAAPWDQTQLGLIADDLEAAITDSYMPHVSNEYSFLGIVARDLEQQFGRVQESSPPAPVVGTKAVPALPPNNAVVASWIGNPGAAPARGRIFLLPPCEDQVVGALLSGAALAFLQTAAEAIHNAMSSTGPAHVIVSRYNGTLVTVSTSGRKFREPIKRAVAVTNTVPSVIVRNRIDSQRSRSPVEA